MKKLILTCALISFVSVLSYGQNTAAPATTSTRAQAPAPEKAAEMRANRYKQQLNLTDEQYKGVYAAELEYVKQDQMFRANGQPVPDGPAMQMRMAHDQKFQQVLTAEQYAKYEKMKATKPGAAATHAATPSAH